MAHTAGMPLDLLLLDDDDPAGDLLLVLETDEDGRSTKSSIRVSSKVMSLASPVFAAMLSPKFAEGQALLKTTSPQTVSISLPDNDPEAMVWLCQALHFNKSCNIDIDFSLLGELAILCNNYDFVDALKPWSRAWMQKWPGSFHGLDGYAQMFRISYALGNHEQFWLISRGLMQSYTTVDLGAFVNEEPNAMLTARLFGRFIIPALRSKFLASIDD